MKSLVISINDIVCYIALFIFTVAGFIIGGNAGHSLIAGILGGVIGFCFGSLISGIWFVLSGIYFEMKKMNSSSSV